MVVSARPPGLHGGGWALGVSCPVDNAIEPGPDVESAALRRYAGADGARRARYPHLRRPDLRPPPPPLREAPLVLS